ncbi:MAG: hypothetical protein D6737_13535 [Chloroflexi bacterium]|nr:MAG: hypothetical protein CUN54_03280 [Phototrophicales bacterium]RMF78799.1 MAG: hypothetical protein D6737_13535 [Chloroflexota bacterium]
MAKYELQKEARQLRTQGYSVRDIAKMLKISKSSVSLWVRDIELNDEQKARLKARHGSTSLLASKANQEKHRKLRAAYQMAGREKARENDLLHLAGCMLYWAEGANARNKVHFVNSDPNMVAFFMRFLRDAMNIEDDAVAIYIHCHTHHPEEIRRIEFYWLELLDLPETCLRKTYVKEGSESRHNRLVNGVCTINISSTELVQRIYGAIQEYAGFENPAWLD